MIGTIEKGYNMHDKTLYTPFGLTVHEAEAICGKLSNTTKMPGLSYGIPASACVTGHKLREIAGSSCSKCYACKGHYTYPKVQNVMQKRLASITHPQWVEAVATLVTASNTVYFRWHDSGDIQSVEHLKRICQIARLCPNTQFWLPTRETQIYRKFLSQGYDAPVNMIVRVSAAMIDEPLSAHSFPHRSYITRTPDNVTCIAKAQGNVCGFCRACWDKSIAEIVYPLH